MKKANILKLTFLGLILSIFNSCTEGPMGPPGRDGYNGRDGNDGNDGIIDVYYTPWISPVSWGGQTGDWFFQVSDVNITQGIVEGGIILAYCSLPNDVYDMAVRPMPCFAVGSNWDFLIPDYELIEFTTDAVSVPGTDGLYFRYVLVPPGTPLKSSSSKNINLESLKNMPYHEVCQILGIPE